SSVVRVCATARPAPSSIVTAAAAAVDNRFLRLGSLPWFAMVSCGRGAAEFRLPLRCKMTTRNRGAAQLGEVDPPRVGDVVERIGIEHDKVGALAGGHRPEIVKLQYAGRNAGSRLEHLVRRHAGGDHVLKFRMHGPADELVALLPAAVGADAD